MTFNNQKTRTWDRQTLNDGDYFESEFVRVYDNLTNLDGRLVDLTNNIDNLTSITESHVAGIIQGDLYQDKSGGGSGNIARQGFYDGDWRILGIDFYDTTRSYRWIRSYRSGYDRNDNEIVLKGYAGRGNPDTCIMKYSEVIKLWGHDYSYAVPDGAEFTFHRNGHMEFFTEFPRSTNVQWRGISINTSATERAGEIWWMDDFLRKTGYGVSYPGLHGKAGSSAYLSQEDVVRLHGINTDGDPAYSMNEVLQIRFVPD